jgi:hypothetical protein
LIKRKSCIKTDILQQVKDDKAMRKLLAFILIAFIVPISIAEQPESESPKKDALFEKINRLGPNQIKRKNKIIHVNTTPELFLNYYETFKLNENQQKNTESYRALIPIKLKDYDGRIQSLELILDIQAPIDPSISKRLKRFFFGKSPSCKGRFVIDTAAIKEADKFSGSGFLEVTFLNDSAEQIKTRINIVEGEFLLGPVKNRIGSIMFSFVLSDGSDFSGWLAIHSGYCRVPIDVDWRKLFAGIGGFIYLIMLASRFSRFVINRLHKQNSS